MKKDSTSAVKTPAPHLGAASVTIRAADSRDVAAIVAFNAALAWESEGKRLDLEVLRRGVGRVLATPALGRYLVAETQGQVIGQTMLTYELTDWRDGILYWIQSVYVVTDQRRRGVFRQLYQAVQTLARQDPAARGLRLYVEHENAGATSTYTALGMKRSPFDFYEAQL